MIAFYKPNKSNKGHGCSFQYPEDPAPKNLALFFNFAKQSSWDASKGQGAFQNRERSHNVSGKLNQKEAGEIIHAIEKNVKFSTVHKSAGQALSITFEPYMREGKQVGFSFAVFQTPKDGPKKGFYIGFSFGEAVVVREFLLKCLEVYFETKIAIFQSYERKVPAKGAPASGPLKETSPASKAGANLDF